jgi:starch phosphorylase
MAGNEEHEYGLLKKMSFFYHLQDHEVKHILNMEGEMFSYTLGALKFSGKANGVSKLHGEVAREMWGENEGIPEITSITNAQNAAYWKDQEIAQAIREGNDQVIIQRKKELKKELFKVVADQCGKVFDEDVLTIVWARRFAGYKRADLVMYDWDRFLSLISNTELPVQFIWAGKPYPEDTGANKLFNDIITRAKTFANCAVLTGYELGLSALLKKGSDLWLNNPKMYREASGTSGMTAAMNGSINLSLPDGWVPEFARDTENCFLISAATERDDERAIDVAENKNLMDLISNTILPMYTQDQAQWLSILKNSAADVEPEFESGRMAAEYYEKMYTTL